MVVCIALGLCIYWLMSVMVHRDNARIIERHDETDVETTMERLLATLTEEADRLFREKRFMDPDGRDAWRLYRAVLCLDPADENAVHRIDLMAKTLHEWGEHALGNEDYAKARDYYDRGSLLARRDSDTARRISEGLEKLRPYGERWRNPFGTWFARIPAGSFLMGSPGHGAGEKECQHPATITKEFYLSVYELTVGEFEAFVNDTDFQTDAEKGGGTYTEDWNLNPDVNWRNPGLDQGRNHPVACVSWYDAIRYCIWLSEREGLKPLYKIIGDDILWEEGGDGYRLPTETEWEYACRAGTTTRFYTGNTEDDLARAGWYEGNSEKRTHPVGQREPNAWGLYDMHGNIFEFCWDWNGEYPTADVFDARGPEIGRSRVFRGGAWNIAAKECRCAFRYGLAPTRAHYYVGVRLVRPSCRGLKVEELMRGES